MFCMLFQGFYRWAAQVPALLQGLCSEHPPHSQSADYRLPLPQSGPPAEVRTARVFLRHNITPEPELRLSAESNTGCYLSITGTCQNSAVSTGQWVQVTPPSLW